MIAVPRYLWPLLNEEAQRCLLRGADEGARFNHPYIGTEHLLLGLLKEGNNGAAQVLMSLGIELPKVRSAVEFIIGRGELPITEEIRLTPRAKKVLELAVDEANRRSDTSVGPEHILLGIVREGWGIATGVIESLGVNLEKVRVRTLEHLQKPSVDSFTRDDLSSLMGLINEIPLIDVLLLKYGVFTIEVLLRAHQGDNAGLVERAIHRKWVLETVQSWIGATVQSHFEAVGECPGLVEIYKMGRGVTPVSSHVAQCPFCSVFYNGVVANGSTTEALEPTEPVETAVPSEPPAPQEVKRRRRKKAVEEDSSSTT